MKIFDCFMYFDEDLLLKIRLETLHKYVEEVDNSFGLV